MAKKKNDLPLFPHQNGQWAKKIRNKVRYFGSDKDAALKKWAEDKDYLLAGLEPPRKDGRSSIKELGNVFIAGCRQRVSEGDLEQRSADDYEKTIGRLIEFVGRDRRVEDLTPLDYRAIKEKLHDPVERTTAIRGGVKGRTVARRSATTVAGDIRRIRAFLTWASDAELIATPPRFGKEFSPTSKKSLRRQRAKAVRLDIQPAELRSILSKCSRGLKPLVLLGINAGMGNLDIADMSIDTIANHESSEVWVDLPRGKTGAPRRFVLWPETVAAIRLYMEHRPEPAGKSNSDRLFLTRQGLSWVRTGTDAIGGAFARARDAAEVERGTFYDLRRTFQTIGSQTRDFPAVAHIMGHVPASDDMQAIYNQHIDDDRIRVVCEHVRAWLFATTEKKSRVAKAS